MPQQAMREERGDEGAGEGPAVLVGLARREAARARDGAPVKKAASRSCLQRPSVSSDSQQMPESVCGPPGKMLSNVSDRRAGVD